MKAIYINEFGGSDKLIYSTDYPKPEVKEGELLIRIKAASINPVDTKIRQGLLVSRVPTEFPAILGWDFSGIVEEVGYGVSRFRKGDEVYAYARRPQIKHGTYSEYISIPESYVAMKPKKMSFNEASALPLVGLTALQSLQKAGIKQGITVLILGASGGVGSVAIQLCKIMGAKVIGLASSANAEYLISLGADGSLNYENDDWVSVFCSKFPEKADIVFDCISGETANKSLQCLKKDRVFISILQQPNIEFDNKFGIRTMYHFVAPNAVELETLATWVDNGRLKAEIQSIYSLQDAAKAHTQIESKHTRGKIVLVVE